MSRKGLPNGGQWYCAVCGDYFRESWGAIFYRKRYPAKQIIQPLAEGMGILPDLLYAQVVKKGQGRRLVATNRGVSSLLWPLIPAFFRFS